MTQEEESIPLEGCLITADLEQRANRAPDYEAQSQALLSLACAISDCPESILEKLSDIILNLLQVESAGVSLLTEDESRFYWPAISGLWKHQIGNGTPRNFGPCGDVLDRNAPLLFKSPERRYQYINDVIPPVGEVLVVPFYMHGKAVGTVWAVNHDPERLFDKESLRQLESIAKFASSAYWTIQAIDQLKANETRLRESYEQNSALLENAVAERTDQLRNTLVSAQKANDLKMEFVSTMSHEVRTPLAGILGFSEVLTTMKLDPDAAEMAGHIFKSSQRLMSIVNDLLDFSKLEAGKVEVDCSPFSPTALIDETERMLETTCQHKHISIIKKTDQNVPEKVEGDEQKVRQILTNLVSNAVKFSESSVVTIKCSITRETEKIQLLFSVQDCGIGISSEAQKSIFQPFTQADASTTRRFGGSGLGLSICKRYVELLGGQIGFESVENMGSNFWFSVPVNPL